MRPLATVVWIPACCSSNRIPARSDRASTDRNHTCTEPTALEHELDLLRLAAHDERGDARLQQLRQAHVHLVRRRGRGCPPRAAGRGAVDALRRVRDGAARLVAHLERHRRQRQRRRPVLGVAKLERREQHRHLARRAAEAEAHLLHLLLRHTERAELAPRRLDPLALEHLEDVRLVGEEATGGQRDPRLRLRHPRHVLHPQLVGPLVVHLVANPRRQRHRRRPVGGARARPRRAARRAEDDGDVGGLSVEHELDARDVGAREHGELDGRRLERRVALRLDRVRLPDQHRVVAEQVEPRRLARDEDRRGHLDAERLVLHLQHDVGGERQPGLGRGEAQLEPAVLAPHRHLHELRRAVPRRRLDDEARADARTSALAGTST